MIVKNQETVHIGVSKQNVVPKTPSSPKEKEYLLRIIIKSDYKLLDQLSQKNP